MARLESFDDPDWMEVTAINNYAVFMGYLLIGVRGLSLLMVTWTTVVLLGGFVSVLQKKDFWALTFITLVQAAGVFDFLLKEKLRDVGRWIWGLLAGLVGVFATPNPSENSLMLQWAALGLLVVQLLVFIIILCPLAILYVLGLYISAWISLRRLIEHDYGNTDESANLEPALVVLYSLGVAQGVLFGYRAFYGFRARKKIAKFVADHYNLGQDIVLDYLDETVRVCEKDPSLAKGRNLVTYAVDMTESKLCDTYINGVSILGTIIYSSRQEEKRVLAKQLLTGSPSSSFIIRKLLQTMGPRSPYSTEIKEHAAKIMVLVAGGIRLEQFPGGIQCIYSLLDPLDVYKWRPEGYERDSRLPEAYERDWLLEEYESSCYLIYKLRKQTDDNVPQETDSNYTVQGHRGLVVQGLCILQKLSVDEDNCRVICSTESLLSKIMIPLISDDELQMYHHDEWCSIVEESLELISRLMATPGETGERMHHEISSNIKAVISTLESIVECHKCELLLKRQAVEILLDLSVDTSSIMTNGTSYTIFNWILLHILHFPDNIFGRMRGTTHWAKKSSYIRRLAGEKLSAMLSLQSKSAATLESVLHSLTKTVIDGNIHKVYAAQFLENLCRYYIKDDEFLRTLKKAIAEVLPQVLREILDYGSTGEETQAVIEPRNIQYFPARGTGLGSASPSHGNGEENTSYRMQNGEKHEGSKLRKALIRLCNTIRDTWYSIDLSRTRELDEIAEKIRRELGKPEKMTFRKLVEEAEELLKKKNTDQCVTGRASSSVESRSSIDDENTYILM
ncbi:hypothetical protein ACP70R_023939 [Stipagrostis hirtigluma subsp. patula]